MLVKLLGQYLVIMDKCQRIVNLYDSNAAKTDVVKLNLAIHLVDKNLWTLNIY
jgi:hypothetical protein